MSGWKSKVRPIMYFVLIFLFCIGIIWWQKYCSVKLSQQKQACLNNHSYSRWDDYTKIGGEFVKLREKFSTNTPQAQKFNRQLPLWGELPRAILERQLSQVDQIFQVEAANKLDKLNQRLQEFRAEQLQKMSHDYQMKMNELDQALLEELKNNQSNQKNNYAIFCEELESKQQLKLTNLQLQLALINDHANSVADKERFEEIQAEIEMVREEMEELRKTKFLKLEVECDTYEKKRHQEIGEELKNFQAHQAESFKNYFFAYKQKLELEFDRWVQQRNQEINQVIKDKGD